MSGYGLSAEMFDTQRINFHSFDGNKNGSPKEHKFRVLPNYAPAFGAITGSARAHHQ